LIDKRAQVSTHDKKTILLVEDEAIIALALEKDLQRFGFEVCVAYTGEKAVEYALSEPRINLVLTDLDLGAGIDGTEAAKRILSHRELPIVFHTNHTEQDYVKRVKEITNYGYIVKSSGEFVLRESINMALELFEAKQRTRSRERALEQRVREVDCLYEIEKLAGNTELTEQQFLQKVADRLVHRWEGQENVGVTICAGEERVYSGEFSQSAIAVQAGMEIGTRRAGFVQVSYRQNEAGPEPDSVLRDENKLVNSVAGRLGQWVLHKEFARQTDFQAQLLRCVQHAVMATDLNGNITYWNSFAEQLYGWRQTEVLGRNVAEITVPETSQAQAVGIMQQLSAGKSWEGEFVARNKAGERFSIHAADSPMYDEHGRLAGIVGISYDISERKRMEEERDRLMEEYETVFHGTQNVLFLIEVKGDNQFVFIRNNRAHQIQTGIPLSVIEGKTPKELLGPEAGEEVSKHYQRCVDEGKPVSYEEVLDMPAGKKVWSTTLSPIVKDGRVVFIAGAGLDITQRKGMEERLEHDHWRLQNIIEGTNAGTWEWNVQSGDVALNERWAQMAGYTLRELSPLSIKIWEELCHPEDLKQWDQEMRKHFSGESPHYDCVLRMRHKAGHWIWIHDRGKVVTWTDEGSPLLMFGTHVDITEHIEAKQRIEKLLHQKEVLLQEAHHRIRNNMHTVMSLLSIEAAMAAHPDAETALSEARNRLQSMTLLYDKLFRSQRIDAMPAASYLAPLVDQIVSIFPAGSEVTVQKEIDDVVLNASTLSSLGIIANEFITNAMKHAFGDGRKGRLAVTLRAERGSVCLAIKDNGPGFSESELSGQMSGVGITLVKTLAEQIGGTVTVEKGAGTRAAVKFQIDASLAG